MSERLLTEDNIVTVWLQAETNSPRFQDQLRGNLNVDEVAAIIDGNDPNARFDLLAKARRTVRSFPWGDVVWSEHLVVNRTELGNMRTTPGLNWLAFTKGTRLVRDAAAWIKNQPSHLDPHVHVKGVQGAIAANTQLPPMIAYKPRDNADTPLVLLEGHVRAVGHYLSPETAYPLHIYLGQATSNTFLEFDNGLNFIEVTQAFMAGGGEK